MIRDPAHWRTWERQGPQAEPVDVARNFRIFAELVAQARALGRWPPADPLEGLEEKIAWLREMHGRAKPTR
ncbi:MAG TPA: hypothetical protein VN690_03110 [Terriglobales bacterium]|nr:hypothetical protein [Terriglobales bacterium]